MGATDGVTALNGQGIAEKAGEVAKLAAGKAYKWGGKSTDGFDCSGFVSYVFKALYPNQADDFALGAAGFGSSDKFTDVAESDRKAGDLVYFPADGNLVDHVGIVLDEDHWIGSQSSTGVAKVKFSNPWWGKRKRRFRRLGSLSTTALQRGRGQWPAARAVT